MTNNRRIGAIHWWHNWSKWSKPFDNGGLYGRQSRTCKKCGKYEERMVK